MSGFKINQGDETGETIGSDGVAELVVIDDVAVETVIIGGVKLDKGKKIYVKDEVDALKTQAEQFREAYIDALDSLKIADDRVKLVEEKLLAVEATSLAEDEHVYHPFAEPDEGTEAFNSLENLNQGVPTPVKSPNLFVWVTYPNGKQGILCCRLPTKVGQRLRFGGLSSVGYFVLITRVSQPNPLGGPPEMGYGFFAADKGGRAVKKGFVAEQDFLNKLMDHERDPFYVGGTVFGATLILKGYTSFATANDALRFELFKRRMLALGWREPEKKPEPSGPALPSGSASGAPRLEQSASSTAPAAPPAGKPSVAPPPPPPAAPAQNGARTKDREDAKGAQDRTDELAKHLEPDDPETEEALRRLAEQDTERREATGTAAAG